VTDRHRAIASTFDNSMTSDRSEAKNELREQYQCFNEFNIICRLCKIGCFQCFDAVGWAAGRASGL